MWALVLVLIGAAAGSGITWFLGAPDRAQSKKVLETQEKLLQAQQKQVEAQQAAADAQTKIAKLESEREQREFFNQFSPKVTFKLEDHSSENSLALEASEPFIVESIDYLTGSGASVGSQEVEQSSKSVVVPISDEYLLKIQGLGPWLSSDDMSAAIQFRIHILKDGLRKMHVVPAGYEKEEPHKGGKSSGNVFADLGLPHSEQELLKAKVTLQIYRLIQESRPDAS